MKNVVVIGGGTGQSSLLRGLKEFPVNISSVVSVCDDGRTTGTLREEFNMLAVGDIRRVIIALSETEPLFSKLLEYQFDTNSSLNGYKLGNLFLVAISEITGNLQEGIEAIGKVLKLKGKVLPFTLDNPTLVGKMDSGAIIKGEHNITANSDKIIDVYYENEVTVNSSVIEAIKTADLIVLSMGSLYTSVIPNLLSKEMIEEIDKSSAKIMYVCNIMTQPGETDKYKVSDHVKVLNNYLGKKKISAVIANNGEIPQNIINKYRIEEQKEPVIVDDENLSNVKLIAKNYATIENNVIRHHSGKISADIYNYLLETEEPNVLY